MVVTHALRDLGAAPGRVAPGGDPLARIDEQVRMLDAVRGLPEPYRSALFHREIEGLSEAVISRRLRVPPATVAARLRRARALIAARLKSEPARPPPAACRGGSPRPEVLPAAGPQLNRVRADMDLEAVRSDRVLDPLPGPARGPSLRRAVARGAGRWLQVQYLHGPWLLEDDAAFVAWILSRLLGQGRSSLPTDIELRVHAIA